MARLWCTLPLLPGPPHPTRPARIWADTQGITLWWSSYLICTILVITGTCYSLPPKMSRGPSSVLLISPCCNTWVHSKQRTDFPPSPTGLCISRMWVFKYYFIKTPVFLSTFHQFTTAVVWSSSESRWGGPFTIKSCSNCLQARYMREIGWIKGRIYIKYLCRSNRRVKCRYNKVRGLVNL